MAARLDIEGGGGGAALTLDPVDLVLLAGAFELARHEAETLGGSIAARLGLAVDALATLAHVLGEQAPTDGPEPPRPVEAEEESVRELLLANRSSPGPVGEWWGAIIARRAMEPNHLWEDLGLPERPALGVLMARHFAPLAARNNGMRWKRFLYRALCEAEGFVLCATPSCRECNEFEMCFGEETGESRLARIRNGMA